jgi:hypothetical protein
MGHGMTGTGRPALHVVPQPEDPEAGLQPTVTFCGHCGCRADTITASRVCEQCRLGLLLQASASAAPRPGDAFVIVDRSLSICGLSAAAEQQLCAPEIEVVNRHLTELLVPAEAEADGRTDLAVAITWVAREPSCCHVTVRPTRTFGIRLRARIASCGPPQAALLVLE